VCESVNAYACEYLTMACGVCVCMRTCARVRMCERNNRMCFFVVCRMTARVRAREKQRESERAHARERCIERE